MQILQIEKQIDKSQRASKIYALSLSIILTACSFICLVSAFDFPCSSVFIIILSILIPGTLSYLLSSKLGKNLNVLLPMLIAAYFAAANQKVMMGFLIITNSIITKIESFNHLGILTYDTGSTANVNLYTIMALIPIILIFAYLIVISIKHRLFVPVILLTLPPVFAIIYFHVYSAAAAVIFIIIVWAVLFSNALNENSISLRRALWVLSVTALFSIFIGSFIPYSKYTSLKTISSIRFRLADEIESLRYNYGAEKVSMDILPEGDLKNAKTLSYTDEVVMQVKMQKPSAIYLKGYVGSIYSNNSWNSLPGSAYGGDYTGLFEWLSKNHFYPQNQISSLCSVNSQLGKFNISVDNIALESKYIYSPYEAATMNDLSPQNVKYSKDAGIISAGLIGTRTYSFSMYSPITSDYAASDLNKWVKDNIKGSANYAEYEKNEMAYRAFVYKNYMEIPAETKKTLEKYFTKGTLDSFKDKNYQSVIDFLRKCYLQKFTYSTEIKNLPADSDFIANFLKAGSGYDIHFATLSVMLLRSAGIPARYVEGYFLPHSYVDIYAQTKNAVLDVKDSFAHAWTEIYVDGVGWVPAELTPGYFNPGKDRTKSTGKDESISKKDKNFYNDQEKALSNDSAVKVNKKMKFSLLFFAATAAAAAVLLFIIIVLILKAKRKKGFFHSDRLKAALKIYAYAAKLIKIDRIKIDHHRAFESSEEISQKYDELTGMRYKEFLNIVYKARFGSGEPDVQELAYMQSYILSLSKQIYVKQGFSKKLIIKILGLI
ncbi:MAG: transglutaminase-like domain-containing protein [Bacillota bacterium]|nr:transglutaminase-like domain-containing protein [Bacillota bacterium]